MELDAPILVVVLAIGFAWTLFVIIVMVAVLRAADEALIFFRRENARHRAAATRPPVNPADTVWDDIP